MAKPAQPKDNHGSAVSEYVHFLKEQREDGEARGIGPQVSEFASGGKAGGHKDDEGTDNGLPNAEPGEVIVVVDGKPVDGASFDTIQGALTFAEENELSGATIVVGEGTYEETLTLDFPVNIVGEEGAVLDGSSFEVSTSLATTVQLNDGFSGGSITNLDVIAIQGGNAVATAIGDVVTDVSLEDSTFSGGANTAGPVVYLNPAASNFTFEGNTFIGENLLNSPLLGIEADNVTVTGNTFGETAGTYADVEVFPGTDGSTDDVVILGNVGLTDSEIVGLA